MSTKECCNKESCRIDDAIVTVDAKGQIVLPKALREKAKTKTNPCGCSCASTSQQIGYSKSELASVPKEADLNLGCGNPIALASLKEDQTIIDLGLGAGLDCFLAAKKVGAKGKVIEIDRPLRCLSKHEPTPRKEATKTSSSDLEKLKTYPSPTIPQT